MTRFSTTANSAPTPYVASHGLWWLAWRRLRADRVAMVSLTIVAVYLLMLLLSVCGLIAADWDVERGNYYAPPTFMGADAAVKVADNPLDRELVIDYGVPDPLAADLSTIQAKLATEPATPEIVRAPTLPFGADKWGHDIIKKTIKGSETSIIVGLLSALLAVLLGTVFGAVSGYFGGWVDDGFNWFYSVFTSIPYLLLILAVAAVMPHKGIITIIGIFTVTGWTGTYRLIRAEYMKHKRREYVLAADAIGASPLSKMFRHIYPNVSHVSLVQVSLLVVEFIKSEVILSFLGFGVPVGVVSWGSMLNDAPDELLLGKWWQLTAVTVAMAVLVTAFSLFTDALRDALDPKLK